MSVESKIMQYLRNRGITQTFLSKKTKIPLSKLNLSLNEKRRLTFDEYEIICGVLEVNTDQFITPHNPYR